MDKGSFMLYVHRQIWTELAVLELIFPSSSKLVNRSAKTHSSTQEAQPTTTLFNSAICNEPSVPHLNISERTDLFTYRMGA